MLFEGTVASDIYKVSEARNERRAALNWRTRHLKTKEAQVLTATPEQLLYYAVPTPRAPNLSDAVLGFVADTTFSDDRGFYDQSFDLIIACATPGAEIRYTLDGREPTATTGLAYTDPIPITGTVVVRAAAFKNGYQPSNVDTFNAPLRAAFIPDVPDASSGRRGVLSQMSTPDTNRYARSRS